MIVQRVPAAMAATLLRSTDNVKKLDEQEKERIEVGRAL